MKAAPEPSRANARRIVGLAIRTTNAAEMNPPTAKIPALWGRFAAEQWSDKLVQLGGFGPVIAVYSEYESDHSGSYQLLVGREVRGTAAIAGPLRVVSIAAGSYLVFRTHGALPQAVIDGWRDVWDYFSQSPAPARAYTSDFEVYRENQPVEIWIAIRERS